MENKSEYPGFIGGFKASNISTNKSSLVVLSEQISKQLTLIDNDIKENNDNVLKENIKQGISVMKSILDENISPTSLIELYIKFGNLFKSIISSSISNIPSPSKKEIIINYLNIAKYSKDTRIDHIAIDLAKTIDQ